MKYTFGANGATTDPRSNVDVVKNATALAEEFKIDILIEATIE